METISVQQRSHGNKQVSGLRPIKNTKRRSSRGSLSKSGGSLSLPFNPPPPSYSQSPLLPLPRVNSSTLPLQRVNSSWPRVNTNSSLNRVPQTKAVTGTHQKKVEFVESAKLIRTGSVPGQGNQLRDGYPAPVIMLLSPPPSCLPMPRFSIKPKLRCNVEAVATENIRRVLQLR